jgi:predicted PurR-regulated permease PerM
VDKSKYLSLGIVFLGVSILVGSFLISSALTKIANRSYVNTDNISQAINHLAEQTAKVQRDQSESVDTMQWSIATKYLGVSGDELEILVSKTDIPYLLINGKYIFQKDALDQWLKTSGQLIIQSQ